MNVASLKSFVVAAREESFSQAAEVLHLTQSGLSRRIAVLEDELGVKLFDRIGRRVFLTSAGEKLLPHARSILITADNAKTELHNQEEKVSGKLSISTTQHVGLYYLQPVLNDVVKEYPDLELSVEFSSSQEMHNKIAKGDLELALMTEPDKKDPLINYQPFINERMVFAVSNEHPLTTRDTLSIHDLAGHRAVLPDQSSFTRKKLDELFLASELKLQVSSPSNYLEALRLVAATGLGWTLLPLPMIDDRLTRLPLSNYETSRPLVIAYHKNRTLSTPARIFINRLENLNNI